MNRLSISSHFCCALATACAVAAACAAACSGSSTAPAPVPPPPPPALKLTCPDSVSVQSTTGQPIPVHYGTATSTGGTAPVQIACTPANDSVFDIGAKAVSCTATDAKSVTDTCSFTVTVTTPPKISVTRFVAFGDSMTAGEVVSEGSVGGIRAMVVDFAKSYPNLLHGLLAGRYTGQAGAIVVGNAGFSGEQTSDGLRRLPSVIDGGAYDALLLMEGANDFPNYQTALGNMRSMVQYGKRRSVRVYLATLPPEDQFHTTCINRGKNQAFVAPYNDGLQAIANAENVTLVDVFTAFGGDTTTLIDCDGLHPTPAGYQRIADTFFTSIKATLEVPATATPTVTGAAFRTTRARKSR